MQAEIIRNAGMESYVRSAGSQKIAKEQDILDILGYCGEIGSNRIMLLEQQLSDEFFRLRTGLLGAVFQKLSNYRVRTAIVISFENAPSARFSELMYETNRGNQIRFFKDITSAERWLID